jgi:preprotein translocase subunit SecF
MNSVSASEVSRFRRLGAGATSYPFVERSKYYLAASILVILVGLVSLSIKGLNFGIDFRGGVGFVVPSSSLTTKVADQAVSRLGIRGVTAVAIGSGSHRTVEIEVNASSLPRGNSTKLENRIDQVLARAARVPSSVINNEYVGPTWGSQITSAAVKALVAFFAGIFLYISIRFEWRMALSAMIAVVHDLLVTVGIYSLSGFQVTPSTVIALLTILGYSLYDTIVVFDRIKENVAGLVDAGKMTYKEAVNLSENQMLARSLNTSIVAVIPILSVLVLGAYVFGATTLKNFGLALVIGLTSGAYSSLFIASPILAWIKGRQAKYRQLEKRLLTRRKESRVAAGGLPS